VVGLAGELARQAPGQERAWICWAYALRELQRTAEARDVLLQAEPQHGAKCAVLHYNLGCYYCLLGDRATARKRLKRAFALEPEFKRHALEDRDLEAMWDELRREQS
jgi:Flp pilus assembly protein TadD